MLQTSSTHRRSTTSLDGFTLIELLLVLALLTLVASVAWPSMLRMQRDIESDQAVEQFRDLLHAARILAIDTGHNVIVTITPGEQTIQLQQRNPLRPVSEMNQLAGEVRFLSPYVSKLQGNTVSTSVTFYPDGTATDALFVLTDKNSSQRLIRVHRLTGSVREDLD